MKKKLIIHVLTIAACSGIILSLQGCSKLAQDLTFNNLQLQPGAVTFIIPPTDSTNVNITLGSALNSYNIDSFIKANTANQLGISNITGLKLTSCVLTITNGANSSNNLQNIQYCTASFYSSSFTTPYAISDSVADAYATTLTIPVDTTVQLENYISGSSTQTFYYSVSGKLRTAVTDTLTCSLSYTFSMSVKG